MNPDQQIELYRAARSIAWSYRLQEYNTAALKDLQRIVDKSKESIVQKFAEGLGQEGSYTRKHFQNSLKELERLSLGLRNQLGEQLTTSSSRIGSLALKEWGENLSVGGVAKMVNTVALSPEQFAAFFKRNPPAGILIPKVMRNALNQGVTARIQGELLDVLREGALTGQSYKRIVDKLSESFTDFNRHQLTTLTRTFFQTANAQAFDAVYQANQDIMEGKIWTNVNDDRVCLLCLPLGETLYKKGGEHPSMPRHPNCRCVFRAKTVSYRDLGIDLDELEAVTAPVVTRGYEKNGKWIIPPAGTGTGRRPRAIAFYQGGMKEAFPDLPEAQQKAMLGVGRYNKYKAGDLTLDQLVDKQTGELWLLKELDEGLHLRGFEIKREHNPKLKLSEIEAWEGERGIRGTDAWASARGDNNDTLLIRKDGELKGLAVITVRGTSVPEGFYKLQYIVTKESGFGKDLLKESIALAAKDGKGILLNSTKESIDYYRKLKWLEQHPNDKHVWFIRPENIKDKLKEIEQGMHLRAPDASGFIPSSTLAQAQTKISSSFNIQDIGEFGSFSLSDQAVLSSVNAIGAELQRLENSFPGISKLTTRPSTASIAPNKRVSVLLSDRALGEYDPRANTVNIGPITATGKKPIIGETYSWHAVYDDDLYIFRHEYGHALHNQGLTIDQFEEWFYIYKSKPSDFWEKTVSEYGGTSSSELFAEAFGLYTSPAYKKGVLSEEVERFFEKIFKKES